MTKLMLESGFIWGEHQQSGEPIGPDVTQARGHEASSNAWGAVGPRGSGGEGGRGGRGERGEGGGKRRGEGQVEW